MLKRKILKKLREWKNENFKKTIVIKGGKYVGKTYAVEMFGNEEFDKVITLDFERDKNVHELFDSNVSVDILVDNIKEYFNVRTDIERTLFFFDEVHLCPKAFNYLKSFGEEGKYYVIAATSFSKIENSPGIQILELFPMDFEEFLWAARDEYLASEIRRCYESYECMPSSLDDKANTLLYRYLIIGGMPSVVYKYFKGADVLTETELKSLIIDSYSASIIKYINFNEAVKIISAYETIQNQLLKENKKFQYNLIRKGAGNGSHGDAIEWLVNSNYVLRSYLVEDASSIPLVLSDVNSFKLYFNDTGLLSEKLNITTKNLREDAELKNTLIENYVAIQLKVNGFELMYWESGNTAKTAFIITKENKVLPIEIMIELNSKGKSLNVFEEKYKPNRMIRISLSNFNLENNIYSIPLYAVFCLENN